MLTTVLERHRFVGCSLCHERVCKRANRSPCCIATGEIGSSEHHLHCRRPVRCQVGNLPTSESLGIRSLDSGVKAVQHIGHFPAGRSRAPAHQPDCLQCSARVIVPGNRPENHMCTTHQLHHTLPCTLPVQRANKPRAHPVPVFARTRAVNFRQTRSSKNSSGYYA